MAVPSDCTVWMCSLKRTIRRRNSPASLLIGFPEAQASILSIRVRSTGSWTANSPFLVSVLTYFLPLGDRKLNRSALNLPRVRGDYALPRSNHNPRFSLRLDLFAAWSGCTGSDGHAASARFAGESRPPTDSDCPGPGWCGSAFHLARGFGWWRSDRSCPRHKRRRSRPATTSPKRG